jgi:aspartyl-tRNA(Asn)/glutamyl-tRNA(Gln) amidotransferase subunit A
MRNDDLALEDLCAIADAIAAKKITSVEATEACLARIKTWQPRTNAFLRVYRDKALAQARAMDAELAAGKRRGPLHGVPMAHKDMYYRKGELSTAGSAIRRDWRAPVTATVLKKLDAAGVVELGFLNMAEFAAGPTGHNVHHGHCRNPWDSTRVTGGSSSGSGASVAARMVYGALGSDTGGSIRLPAAACGVVGMKATYGRVSRAGAIARSWSLDHVGPLTRTVRDNARMLAILAGHDPNDSTTSEKPVPDYEALLEGGVAGLRIGLALPNDGPAPLEASIGAVVQAAADMLGKLGARISPVVLPDFTALYRSAEVMVKCEAAAMHRPWMEKTPELYANQVRTRMETGFFIPATQYIDALRLRALSWRSSWPPRWTASMPCCCPRSPFRCPPSRRPTPRPREGRPCSRWWRASPASPGRSTRWACRRCRYPAVSTRTVRRSGCNSSAGRSTRRCCIGSVTPIRARPTII